MQDGLHAIQLPLEGANVLLQKNHGLTETKIITASAVAEQSSRQDDDLKKITLEIEILCRG